MLSDGQPVKRRRTRSFFEAISLAIAFFTFCLVLLGQIDVDAICAQPIIILSQPIVISYMILATVSFVLFIFFTILLFTPTNERIGKLYEKLYKRVLFFQLLWIVIMVNFTATAVHSLNQLSDDLRLVAIVIILVWLCIVMIAILNLIRNRWQLSRRMWQALTRTNWRKHRPKLLRPGLVFGAAAFLLLAAGLVSAIIWLARHYRPGEFTFDFATNIVATVIGVIFGALLAILVTIAVINPYVRRKEEKKLEPLRRPILLFWDHTLALYTIGVLQAVNCPQQVERIIADVNTKLIAEMDSCADEQKLLEIQQWLKELCSGEELSVRSFSYFEQSLNELKDFIERMHDTLVALPYLFKKTPEVASGVEILTGNFLSGLRMLDYKAGGESESDTAILDFYSTAIIKNTANEAFLLVREIRHARLEH